MRQLIIRLFKPRAIYAKWLLLLLAAAFMALGFMDYLKPIEAFLSEERFAFRVGAMRVTLYMVLEGLVTLIALFWLTGIISEFGEQRLRAIKGIRASNRALIIKAFQILVYFIAALIMLEVLGIDLTTLTVFSGAIGIGIGFGLQKITSNFISGLILLFEKSVEHDDLIELEDGTFGFIRHTGARYTLMETFDGKEIMIPNEDFITSRVTNWTFSSTRGRVEIVIGVSYDSDIEQARELMLEAAIEHPRSIADPEPVCFLREFADSSVNFLLYFWVEDVTLGRYEPKSDVMRAIWKKFKEHQIVIPFPQRDLHLKTSLPVQEAQHA
jgi:small-conductance mechanosensitive channel